MQVLQGTFILFSGVIPLQQAPHDHPLWKMALKFGARCTIEKHDEVTHVVAKSSLTEKVWACCVAMFCLWCKRGPAAGSGRLKSFAAERVHSSCS